MLKDTYCITHLTKIIYTNLLPDHFYLLIAKIYNYTFSQSISPTMPFEYLARLTISYSQAPKNSNKVYKS